MENLKIKPLTKEKLIISIDRLTRFKNTELKYLRVFKDLLLQNLISPKFSKAQLDLMDYSKLTNLAQEVLNESIKNLGLWCENDCEINKSIYDYENSVFIISDAVQKLLKNKINYKACCSLIDSSSVKNLRWLKSLCSKHVIEDRKTEGFLFPVQVVIIAEGATEETLLPEFGKICGYDFSKEGVYLISAGGKNQVVRLYYELSESLRIPVFVLLDKDGAQNFAEIMPKLRKMDYIHLLDCGEFEDLLPINLIKRTLDYELKNISELEKDMIDDSVPRTKFLEEVFKNRGMHEFKKVEFAHMVKNNLKSEEDISPEIAQIINQIKILNKNFKQK